jgi:hypothetical protein
MDKNYKNDLKDLVEKSNLNENQKMLWELFMKISNAEEDEAVFEAASEAEDNLSLLTEHLRGKIWEMKESDHEAWEKLTKNEEQYAKLL